MIRKTSLRAFGFLPWLVSFAVGLTAMAVGAAEPSDSPNGAVIQLTNGDYVTGRLVDSQDGGSLAWRSPAFSAPLQFATRAVNHIQFPIPAKLPQPEGDYCFELAGGDLLFGSLVGLQGHEAALDVSGIGRLHVELARLRRMYRWYGDAELLFVGPRGLESWETSGDPAVWSEENGHLFSDQSGAIIRRDFGLPPLARLEFELSWKERPDFEFAVGVGDSKTAFRFEVWDHELVIVRETERESDIASLQAIPPGPGRIHLQAFFDQQQGRMLVFSSSGEQLADLQVSTENPQAFGGLQLTNKTGDIRLERLSVRRWNGELPRTVAANQSRIHTTDGSIMYGQFNFFDAARHEFVVQVSATEQRVAERQVQDIFFSQENVAAPQSLQAVYFTGQRIGGDLVKVEQNQVWLKCPGIREEFASPVEALQSLVAIEPEDVSLASNVRAESAFPAGRLELEGAVLHGSLVDTELIDEKRLVWKPAQSQLSSPLQHGVSARLLYRDLPPQHNRSVPRAGVIGQDQGLPTGTTAPSSRSKTVRTKPVLHLRCGDAIPCDLVTIDETGITFAATSTDATFLRHDQLNVLELLPGLPPVQIAQSKMERLLALPRWQRDNPPTNLIQSVDGDYLRGRLVSMDEQQLQVEIRLAPKRLPRDRVARIIWLHPDEVDGAAEPESATVQADQTRVQTLSKDHNRLTFIAEQLAGTILSGRSEFLEACQVDLQRIDQLLIGTTVEQADVTLASYEWRLKATKDPVSTTEDGDNAGDGTVLVGKTAPDFELDLLDGTKFRLSEHHDKFLVLDFWASWCEPCLQVMPQIHQVIHEFADQGVELVAINLEETGDRIQATLDRLKLNMPVGLDRDGRTAEKYGATSIPQTVIIDRSGKVVRLFVGGGARFGDQLRAALHDLLSDQSKKNMLERIDIKRDAVQGAWRNDAGLLESPKLNGARIEMPVPTPQEYELTVVVEPLDEPNGLILGQSMAGRRFQVVIHFIAGEPCSVIESIDGKDISHENPTIRRGAVLEQGRRSKIVCTVRKGQVEVICDGKRLLEWEGDPKRLGMINDDWKTPHANFMYLGADNCRYRFHEVTLTSLDDAPQGERSGNKPMDEGSTSDLPVKSR